MKVLIAMSGGVDSSLAAKIMTDQGYDCIGCTMKLYDDTLYYNNKEKIRSERPRSCCSLNDVEDARSVAYKLGMPYYVFNFMAAFREQVLRRFVRGYEAGVTPNPCIDCNRYLKFARLLQRAQELGCNYVATGHYARIEYDGERYLLKKAADETKDQSYVLYTMTQAQLAHTLFPLGGMRKAEVRRLAAQNGFVNAQKPESQDICFVPDGNYTAFLERCTGKSYPVGDFISAAGAVLGRHKGIVRYTIGQRRGLGLALPEPMYVSGLDAEKNTVTIGSRQELYSTEAIVGDCNWVSGDVLKAEIRCKVKIRYRQAEQWAIVMPAGDKAVRIVFDEPQWAITPGQAAVLYDGDVVLGGGTICCSKGE